MKLHIEIQPKRSSTLAGLRADAILERSVAGSVGPIPLLQGTTSGGEPCLQADVTLDDSVSHVVLAVVNTESGVPVRADDRKYDVRVTP